MTFLDSVKEFVALQQLLVAALLETCDGTMDEFLFRVPKTTKLSVNGETWSCSKHGLGVLFTGPNSLRVDVHQRFSEPNLFDEWRLQIYFRSQGRKGVKLLERTAEDQGPIDELLDFALKDLVEKDLLRKKDGMLYINAS